MCVDLPLWDSLEPRGVRDSAWSFDLHYYRSCGVLLSHIRKVPSQSEYRV